MTSRFLFFVILWASTGSGEVAAQTVTPTVTVHVNSSVQFISSSNYPHPYPTSHTESWLLKASHADYKVEINVKSSALQNCDYCACDYIAVHDGRNKSDDLLDRFCGGSKPTLRSTGQYLFVVFRSDSSAEKSGFKAAVYEVEPGGFPVVVIGVGVFVASYVIRYLVCPEPKSTASVKPKAQKANQWKTTKAWTKGGSKGNGRQSIASRLRHWMVLLVSVPVDTDNSGASQKAPPPKPGPNQPKAAPTPPKPGPNQPKAAPLPPNPAPTPLLQLPDHPPRKGGASLV